MKKRIKICGIIVAAIVAIVLIYFIIQSSMSVYRLVQNKIMYGNSYSGYAILGFTQLSCLLAIFFNNIVFITILCAASRLRGYNKVTRIIFKTEQIFAIISTITYIIIYAVIAKVAINIDQAFNFAYIFFFVGLSIGFCLYNVIGILLNRDNTKKLQIREY